MTYQENKRKEDSPLNYLLSLSKSTKKKVQKNQNGKHFICFPSFWSEKWDTRYVISKVDGESIFIYPSTKADKNAVLLTLMRKTLYIPIENSVMEKLGNPEYFTIQFFVNYLEIVIPKEERERTKQNKIELETINKKKNTIKRQSSRLL